MQHVNDGMVTLARVAMRYTCLVLICLIAACGASDTASTQPTAATKPIVASATPTLGARPTPAPTLFAPSSTPAAPTPMPPAEPMDQYRAWMDEAHKLYPYSEPVEKMWELMICESSGNPDIVEGPYHGLFQYTQEAWAGDWNPYRDSSILDPRAQIFATAKAWYDGHQSWWGCYQ